MLTALLHQSETSLHTGDFLDKFGNFLPGDSVPLENVLVVGGFSFQMAKLNDPDTRRCVLLYSQLGLDQFVTQPTRVKGHILDIVLCSCLKSLLNPYLYLYTSSS